MGYRTKAESGWGRQRNNAVMRGPENRSPQDLKFYRLLFNDFPSID